MFSISEEWNQLKTQHETCELSELEDKITKLFVKRIKSFWKPSLNPNPPLGIDEALKSLELIFAQEEHYLALQSTLIKDRGLEL